MLNEMMQYTIRRTDAGRFVTIRDISKRFSVPTQDVIDLLTGEVSGYTVTFSDAEVKGTTVVTVTDPFADEGSPLSVSQAEVESDRDVVFHSHGSYRDEPVPFVEADPAAMLEALRAHVEAKEAEGFVVEPEAEAEVEEPATASDAERVEGLLDAIVLPKPAASRKYIPGTYVAYETVEAASEALGYDLISIAELHKACVALGFKVNRMVKAFGGDRLKWQPRSAEWTPVIVGRTRYVAKSCVQDLKNL